MISRKWMVSLTLVGAVGVMTACGGGDGDTPKPSTSSSTSAADAKKITDTPTEIAIHVNSTTPIFMERMGNKLQERFPNFTFKHLDNTNSVQKILETSNQPIDILVAPSIGTNLIQWGLQNDISDLIKKYNYDLSRVQPTLIQAQKDVGGIYGLPYNMATYNVVYNKDLFNKFGVPYPKDSMSWDEMYEVSRKMTRTVDGVKYYGLTVDVWFSLLLNQYTVPVIDAKTSKANFTNDQFTKIFENIARFYKIPGSERENNKYSSSVEERLFFKDKVSAMMMSTVGIVKETARAGIDFDLIQVPVYKDLPDVGYNVNPTFFFLTSRSTKRDAAFQVLAYITSDEFQEWQARTQALPPVLINPDKIMESYAKDVPELAGKKLNHKAIIPKKFPNARTETAFDNFARGELDTALNDYINGKDINTALRAAAERTDAVISSKK